MYDSIAIWSFKRSLWLREILMLVCLLESQAELSWDWWEQLAVSFWSRWMRWHTDPRSRVCFVEVCVDHQERWRWRPFFCPRSHWFCGWIPFLREFWYSVKDWLRWSPSFCWVLVDDSPFLVVSIGWGADLLRAFEWGWAWEPSGALFYWCVWQCFESVEDSSACRFTFEDSSWSFLSSNWGNDLAGFTSSMGP